MRKLIPYDRYEGLDEELRRAIEKGQVVKGRDADGAHCYLYHYNCFLAPKPYLVEKDPRCMDGYWTENFTPAYEPDYENLRPTKDTPVDTLLLVWDGAPEDRPDDASGVKAYFACMEGMYGDIIKCWWGGRTSENETCKTPWDHAIILKYPGGTKPGATKND